MTNRTSICPTCGRRAPEAVHTFTDSEVAFFQWIGVAAALVMIGFFGFFVGVGSGILSYFGVAAAVHVFQQRRLDRECAMFARETSKVIEG